MCFLSQMLFTDSSSVISASMQRRRYRGKNVITSGSTNDLLQLTESGAGEKSFTMQALLEYDCKEEKIG